jgi:hypothetical protein
LSRGLWWLLHRGLRAHSRRLKLLLLLRRLKLRLLLRRLKLLLLRRRLKLLLLLRRRLKLLWGGLRFRLELLLRWLLLLHRVLGRNKWLRRLQQTGWRHH